MPGIQRVKYATDAGSIFNVLLDENTGVAGFIGTLPTGPYTENMTIKVSKNRRQIGIKPRRVLLSRTIGAGDPDVNGLIQTGDRYKSIPIPTKERWDAIVLQSTIVLGGTTYRVRKKLQEEVA